MVSKMFMSTELGTVPNYKGKKCERARLIKGKFLQKKKKKPIKNQR